MRIFKLIKVYLGWIVFLFYLHFPAVLLSQGFPNGVPSINSFDAEKYKASISNWEIVEEENGFIYVANNDGVLQYNGFEWSIIELPNKSIVRSISRDGQGGIVAGGQDEVGIFSMSPTGAYNFESFRNYIPTHLLPLEDVWDIEYFNSKIYFRSKDRIYIVGKSECNIIETGSPLIKLQLVDDQLYFADSKNGIYSIEGDKAIPQALSNIFQGLKEVSILGFNNEILVLSPESIYKIDNGKLVKISSLVGQFIEENKLSCGISVNGKLVLGTEFGGVCILNNDFKLEQVISIKEGLQTNFINAVTSDKNQNIWLATAHGIDCIYLNDKEFRIYPDQNLKGSLFDMIDFDGKMYYATNNGLYVQDYTLEGPQSQTFQLVPGSKGQVWGLDIIDGELMVAHDNGAFILKQGRLDQISKSKGAWKFVLSHDPNYLYVGTYFGVELYQKSNGEWSFLRVLEGFNESSRLMVKGSGRSLWISHPYRGVYRLELSSDYTISEVVHYTDKKGLPSDKLNYIFEVGDQLLVAAELGVYTYNSKEDRFVQDDWINQYIPVNQNIRHLQKDAFGRLWYVSNTEVAFIHHDKKHFVPELLGNFVGGFEHLYVYDSTTVFACSDQGVVGVDLSSRPALQEGRINLISITAYNKEEQLQEQLDVNSQETELPYLKNDLHFVFASSLYAPDVEFAYRIDKDKEWTPWTKNQEYELFNLRDGTYNLQVKSRSSSFTDSAPFTYNFTILPPWYRSNWAYFLYSILVIVSFWMLLLIPKRQYQKNEAILISEKEKSEAEVERLKNEQLLNEIEHQNAELASSTLHLVQKNTVLNKVRSDIETVRKNAKDPIVRKELKQVLSVLTDDTRLEDDWDNFSIHFDKVHADFLKRLKKDYPKLSPKDQKLAAYLRMNLSSKEIAPLLNISVRGVEISRYRLRKKLELDTGTNLSEWMIDY
jgi:DNA-binding CsgD family transcriptional regulator